MQARKPVLFQHVIRCLGN